MFLVDFPLLKDFNVYIDIALGVILIALVIYFSFKNKLSTKVIVTTSILIALFVLCAILSLPIVRGITIVITCLCTVYAALLLTNNEKSSELRYHKKVSKKETLLTTNETDELISNIHKAITILSSTQTGALITIERLDDLSVLMDKSGTKINAPVTPELLCTIFYKGTPLHDGATIIRGNMVESSAVFYQPTQRPLNGKYGSRHRAAIGISEICDALTIVVSEETGTVSLTYKGELIAVPIAQFKEKFKDYYYSSVEQ